MTTRTLPVLFLTAYFSVQFLNAQVARVDTLQWHFEPGRLAIDADRLTEALAAKGFEPAFFSQPGVELSIIGYADCQAHESRNEDLAKGRCAYLVNYFESGRFGELKVRGKDFRVSEDCNEIGPDSLMRKVQLIISKKAAQESTIAEPIPQEKTLKVLTKSRSWRSDKHWCWMA